MVLSEQYIEIGYSLQTFTRNVYYIQNNKDLKIQTGFVQFNNNEIPVWRPYEPDDKSKYPNWKNGTWKNIYNLTMPYKKGTQYIEYNLMKIKVGKVEAQLPEVQITLAYELDVYLNKEIP